MLSISFTPAITGDQCVTSLPFSNLAPRNDAIAFARTIPAADILKHFSEYRRGHGGDPLVSVHLHWASRDRKPSGFLKRRWSQYVAPADAIATQAAE